MNTKPYDFTSTLYIEIHEPLKLEYVNTFLEDTLARLQQSSEENILIDFHSVPVINSLVMGAIIELWREIHNQDRSLRLLVNEKIFQIMRVARLDQYIDIIVLERGYSYASCT
ncbi:MAG: STAS domain-containing protein [bacterium]